MNRITFIIVVFVIVAAGCAINPAVLQSGGTAAPTAAPVRNTGAAAKDTVPEIAAADNIAPNGTLEDGVDGWMPFGSCQIESSERQSHDGNASAFVFGRIEKWQGIGMNVAEILDVGKTYNIYGWVYLPKGSAKINLTLKRVDDAGSEYIQIGATKVIAKEWTRIAGTYTHKLSGDPKEVTVYFEGPDPNVDFYVDDFAIGLAK
jgi:hypothetical protein